MMPVNKDLWVYIETGRDGSALEAGLQLLTPGRRLADECGGRLTAVILGYDTAEAVETVSRLGTDRIITVDSEQLKEYSTDTWTDVLYRLAKKYSPDVFIIGATARGRDFAPRLSSRLDTGLTADCTGLDLSSGKDYVEWTRPALGGNILATIACRKHRPQMGTVRPGVFKKAAPSDRNPEIIREDFTSPVLKRVKLLRTVSEAAEDMADFDSADIIVSGGRGLGSSDGFRLIESFADALGASVGASRAAVDAGWISHSHQVGQTGSSVSPKLYIACGISGAVQHAAGISGAECIAAINSDKDAPIFKIADFGIVGDLYEVIPEIIKELKRK